MYCAIPQQFLNEGQVCIVNQFFGENKNTKFYDERGHTGIDFKTLGEWKYVRNVPEKQWDRIPREQKEREGRIPLLASFDGVLTLVLNPDKQKNGWGLWLTEDPVGIEQYKSLYWHIETPWHSLRGFRGAIETVAELTRLFMGKRVKANTRVAIAGDNGLSTGPHFHQELYKREKVNGVWGSWVLLDPMKHYTDSDVIYARYRGMNGAEEYWYKGKQVSRGEVDLIRKKMTV